MKRPLLKISPKAPKTIEPALVQGGLGRGVGVRSGLGGLRVSARGWVCDAPAFSSGLRLGGCVGHKGACLVGDLGLDHTRVCV